MNGLDKAGSTPLHWAAQGGHTGKSNRMALLIGVVNKKIEDLLRHREPCFEIQDNDPLLLKIWLWLKTGVKNMCDSKKWLTQKQRKYENPRNTSCQTRQLIPLRFVVWVKSFWDLQFSRYHSVLMKQSSHQNKKLCKWLVTRAATESVTFSVGLPVDPKRGTRKAQH